MMQKVLYVLPLLALFSTATKGSPIGPVSLDSRPSPLLPSTPSNRTLPTPSPLPSANRPIPPVSVVPVPARSSLSDEAPGRPSNVSPPLPPTSATSAQIQPGRPSPLPPISAPVSRSSDASTRSSSVGSTSLASSSASAPSFISRSTPTGAPTGTVLPPAPTLPATTRIPFNVDSPGFTPLYIRPHRPPYGPVSDAVLLFDTVDADPKSYLAVAVAIHDAKVNKTISHGKRAAISATVSVGGIGVGVGVSTGPSCLGPGTNDTTINLLFWYGATTVYLCPGTVVPLYNAIYFTAPYQTLTTLGAPKDSTRAILRITNPNITCAIWANSVQTLGVALRNIQIDGNRPGLGFVQDGMALIEMGGNGFNQVIDNCKIFEPRGWSAMHIIEGYNNLCVGMVITNNQVGPSGHAPSGASQFRRRDSTGSYPGGQWADGISVACAYSQISGNTVTDATDGAIVLFGAPGSMVYNNRIVSNDRQLMGGINMVDYAPWAGNYKGVAVYNNAIVAQNSMIKIGIAIGILSWQTFNMSEVRNVGGSITDNVFTSGSTGYFGYAMSQSGHNNTKVARNYVRNANFGGLPTPPCLLIPPPQPFIQCPYTTQGSTLQSSMKPAVFNFLICNGPGPIVTKGISIAA